MIADLHDRAVKHAAAEGVHPHVDGLAKRHSAQVGFGDEDPQIRLAEIGDGQHRRPHSNQVSDLHVLCHHDTREGSGENRVPSKDLRLLQHGPRLCQLRAGGGHVLFPDGDRLAVRFRDCQSGPGLLNHRRRRAELDPRRIALRTGGVALGLSGLHGGPRRIQLLRRYRPVSVQRLQPLQVGLRPGQVRLGDLHVGFGSTQAGPARLQRRGCRLYLRPRLGEQRLDRGARQGQRRVGLGGTGLRGHHGGPRLRHLRVDLGRVQFRHDLPGADLRSFSHQQLHDPARDLGSNVYLRSLDRPGGLDSTVGRPAPRPQRPRGRADHKDGNRNDQTASGFHSQFTSAPTARTSAARATL